MRARRTILLGLAAAGGAGAALLLWLALQGGDLRWLLAPEVPEVRSRAVGRREVPPAPAPPLPVPAEAAVRELSVAGLKVGPCEGEICREPNVAAAAGRLEEELVGAVRDLKDGAGLFPADGNRIVLVPRSFRDCAFREAFAVRREDGFSSVDLPMEPIVLKWWPAREVMSAALAWAVLDQEIPLYGQTPLWFRAGSALHLSGFGEAYTRRALLESDAPPLLVRPLGDSGDGAWVAGAWAMRALEARKGRAALRSWLSALRSGSPFWEALSQTCGESPEAFESEYRRWAEAYVREVTVNRAELMEAVALLRRGKDAEAAARLEAFVGERPLDLYAGDAAYYLNYARVRRGAYTAAINGFTDLLVNAAGTTSLQGKAHYFMGRAYHFGGYAPLARSEYSLAALSPDSELLRKLAAERIKEME
ncbi:MAG: tetratricopeptide repeat protein [Acidobacteriota bacterium]